MKYLFAALLLLTSCLSLPIRAPSKEISKELDATVALYTLVERDGEAIDFSYCSATWIDDKHILTAAHCVRAMADREADKRDQDSPDSIEGTVIYFVQRNEWATSGPSSVHKSVATRVDEDIDLALLTVSLPDTFEHISIPAATQSPAIGETVDSVGHPKGKRWTFVYGTVSNYSGHWIMINSAIWFGNSGGGIFSKGELVGVCSRLTNIPQEDLFVNVATINEFLGR
jgi:V8-like Glu-specific endopeptidase